MKRADHNWENHGIQFYNDTNLHLEIRKGADGNSIQDGFKLISFYLLKICFPKMSLKKAKLNRR